MDFYCAEIVVRNSPKFGYGFKPSIVKNYIPFGWEYDLIKEWIIETKMQDSGTLKDNQIRSINNIFRFTTHVGEWTQEQGNKEGEYITRGSIWETWEQTSLPVDCRRSVHMNKEKVVLVVLDGFGLGEPNVKTNAIYAANTPMLDFLLEKYSFAKLHASEEYVGIRKNQFGNSELGHMTLGSGRTIYGIGEHAYYLIENNKFNNHLDTLNWISTITQSKTVHIFGLYSSGCVHSDKKNIDATIKYFENKNINIYLHLFSDGRDTSKFSFLNDLKELLT